MTEEASSSERQVLRSADEKFSFNSSCFFCSQLAMMRSKRKDFDIISVKSIELKDTHLTMCQERNDAWATSVQARIVSAHDLHAADAVYHKICGVNFRTMRQIPTRYKNEKMCTKKQKLGHPQRKERSEAFLDVVHFLEENDDEQISVNDLVCRMEDILDGSEHCAYSRLHMQSKLKEHFGDHIVIENINDKPNVVTFRSTAKAILHDFYNSQRKPDLNTDKIRFIQTAAKLLLRDMKPVETNNSSYPTCADFESEENCMAFLPESLRVLLEGMIKSKGSKMKIASIGQIIMQAARPQVLLAPLQFGLGVQMHIILYLVSWLIRCNTMAFAVHIMKYSNLKDVLHIHTKQTFPITQPSLCNMKQIMWTTKLEHLMAATCFMEWE